MSTEAKFEGATLELLKHLKSKKEALQARHTAELAEIEKEIEAVSITARLLREKDGAVPQIELYKPTVIPNNLDGLSAREACIEIAKKNNGIVRVAEAKNALVSAKILKPTKNTWAIVYTTLQRSKEFEKSSTGSGVFRLLTYPTKEAAQASLLQ
ncbi:MAG: hypothetical protein WCF30_16005 [Terracidiphilus sp.]